MAVVMLVTLTIMTVLFTFLFRLGGWPGPYSERPMRELLREYWESRRRVRT